MKMVYDDEGTIIAILEDWQNPEVYFYHYDEEFKSNLNSLVVDDIPNDLHNYKIINDVLIRLTEQEIREMQSYNKILTEEERQLNKLKPSYEEIKKAEQTIEILTLIKEVM